jgi:hypothetical protein
MLKTPDYLLAVVVSVTFRTSYPDMSTVQQAMKDLRDSNLDVGQLVEYRRDHRR